MKGRLMRRPLLLSVHVAYMQYFSTAYRRELVAVFKASCFPFLNCFASFLLDIIFLPALPSRPVYSLLLHFDPHEKIFSPIQDLFCPRNPYLLLTEFEGRTVSYGPSFFGSTSV